MLSVKKPEEVLRIIETEFAPLPDRAEAVPLTAAIGRVLAADVTSGEYVPSFDRSTVDGYAVRARDTFGCSDAIPAILSLRGQVLMGQEAETPLEPGCCIAVPTGGAVPAGADSVVMLEYTEDYCDGSIGIAKAAAPGQNMIFKGDDVFPGKPVLCKGRLLNGRDIGALAAVGCVNVPVVKKPRVGIISTGDELVPPGQQPGLGQIRDVNGPMLQAMFMTAGAEVEYYGIIKDERERLEAAVKTAGAACDMVLISGGSSVGVKDATCGIIESLGTLLLHGIAIKPGKPTILGKCGAKPIVGLPGHPVAAYFVAKLFILPLLGRLIGQKTQTFTVRAYLAESMSANHGRAQYQCVRLRKEHGRLVAYPIRSKSGLITTLAGADGFFCIDRDCEGLPENAEIQVITQ